MEDIFDSELRSSEDLAGVFEFDGETSYFYLYAVSAEGNKVIDSIRIGAGEPDFSGNDVKIKWNSSESIVYLEIKNTICAAFDTVSSNKFGGDYKVSKKYDFPSGFFDKTSH